MSVVLTARDLTRHYEVSRGLFKGSALVRALNGVSLNWKPTRLWLWSASPAVANRHWRAR